MKILAQQCFRLKRCPENAVGFQTRANTNVRIVSFYVADVLLGSTAIEGVSERLDSELTVRRIRATRNVEVTAGGLGTRDSIKSVFPTESEGPVLEHIVFIAHGLGAWIVEDILSKNATENTSITFGTQGMIFLEVPRSNGQSSSDDLGRDLDLLQTPWRSRTATEIMRSRSHTHMNKLRCNLQEIDRCFKLTQESPLL